MLLTTLQSLSFLSTLEVGSSPSVSWGSCLARQLWCLCGHYQTDAPRIKESQPDMNLNAGPCLTSPVALRKLLRLSWPRIPTHLLTLFCWRWWLVFETEFL